MTGVQTCALPICLDYDTEGLLLLTNDGDLAAALTHPRHGVERTYEARVAGMPDEADLAELRQLHEQLEAQVGQRDDFFRTNERFHMRLLALAHNRWREQIVNDLRKVMKLNRHHSLFRQGRIEESLAEHRALLTALEQRAPEQAARLMRAHFDNGLTAAQTA